LKNNHSLYYKKKMSVYHYGIQEILNDANVLMHELKISDLRLTVDLMMLSKI